MNGATITTHNPIDLPVADDGLSVPVSFSAGSSAAAGSDAQSNATTLSSLVARIMGYNGTTWDRIRTSIVAKTATFTGIVNTLGMGRYNLSQPTLTDGDVQLVQLDSSGNTRQVVMNPAVAVDDTNGKIVVEHRYSYANITTQTTTTVKSGAGHLHAITINTIGATGTITIYDNTAGSGTKIGTMTIPAAGAGDMPTSILFDVSFATGLTIVTATATNDLTVSYR